MNKYNKIPSHNVSYETKKSKLKFIIHNKLTMMHLQNKYNINNKERV